MAIPKLLTAEQVAEALDLSEDTLARYRANGTGPNFLKVGDGGNIRYLEEDVIAYLHSSRQLPPVDGNKAATPAAIQAAIVQGRAGVREALNERHQQMKALDDADRDSLGVTPLTVTGVGETPGSSFQRINTVPPTAIVAPAAPHIIQGR